MLGKFKHALLALHSSKPQCHGNNDMMLGFKINKTMCFLCKLCHK